ncbi:MAG: glycosyltransferase family 4 protein [Thermoanaerobaculales bacterium]|nr:glycosyltransferase family 4 protein [Thermoanaerobaculales bacterium]
MRLILLNLAHRTPRETPDELLRRCWLIPEWAEAAAAIPEKSDAGPRVTVVQRFARDADLERGGVAYRMVAEPGPPTPRWWRRPRRVIEVAAAAARRAAADREPCVVHLNGLVFGAFVPGLRRRLPPEVPIVVQHHAERPSPGVRGLLERRGLAAADGFLFAARTLADPWLERRAIPAAARVFEVPEGSSRFSPADRDAARRSTGLDGDPLLLWVGRLDANKDPLTVLEAFETVLPEHPGARLVMAHGPNSPLRAEVAARIAVSETLRRAVRVLGTVPHDGIEAVFQSADLFVLGSHHEGSGIALIEALACGVTPVVTDIPSFTVMTAGGTVGALWPPGRPDELAAALRRVLAAPADGRSAAVRDHFDRHLAWPAVGRAAVAAYREAWERRRAALIANRPGSG